MTDVFLDTGYVVALSSEKDDHHQKACELAKQISQERVQVVTTQDVLVEIGNALASTKTRSFAAKYINAIERAATFEVVEATGELFHRGIELYEKRQDKAWGLTDCMSFTVMRDRGIRDALAHDRDFEQAGFNALLRE
jgi:predicted nucleic acid-binding protein